MKTTLLLMAALAWNAVTIAQKHPKGIEDPEKEIFTKRVQSLTWVKSRFKNEYSFAGSYETEEQLQIYGEAKRILSLYNMTLKDAFFDFSSFCPDTDIENFEDLEKGFELNQNAELLYHLDGDWVLQLNMGYTINSIKLYQWKNTDWSEFDPDPVAEQVELLNLMIE